MIASLVAVFLTLCTVVLYIWFFRSRSRGTTYDAQRNIPLMENGDATNHKKSEEKNNEQ